MKRILVFGFVILAALPFWAQSTRDFNFSRQVDLLDGRASEQHEG